MSRDGRRVASRIGAGSPGPANAPICWDTSTRFSSSQCSTNMQSSARQISTERISTWLPLAGRAIADRRLRDRAARRRLITATARGLAERDGWDGVATRRLSTEIEYHRRSISTSHPPMPSHCMASANSQKSSAGREATPENPGGVGPGRPCVRQHRNREPCATTLCSRAPRPLPFGAEDAPVQSSAAFAEVCGVVASVAMVRDVDTLSEFVGSATRTDHTRAH